MASVHPYKGGYRVMWREANGRQRQRSLHLKKDAEKVARDIERKQELAPFGLTVELEPMSGAQLWADWQAANADLSPNTLASYRSTYRKHLAERIGTRDVRELTPVVCNELATSLRKGKTGPAAQAKALALLSSLLRHAVQAGRLPSHPMRGNVRVPQPRRKRVVGPPAPATIWKLAAGLRARGDEAGRMLVLLVGFAGLRPQEALALDWADVGKRSLFIGKAVVQGQVRPVTKTGQDRSVTLVPALEAELVAYRLAQGGDARGLVLAHNGQPWNDSRYRNWRKRVFGKVATAAGIDNPRPYDLRHAYASLLLHEGRSVIEVAAQLGHSPSVCLDTYGHVMAELGNRRVSAAKAIERARPAADVGPTLVLREGAEVE
jgi:integrase